MSALGGKRIAVTRAADQAEGLCARLERLGATALRCPTIRVLPPEAVTPLDEALSRLGEYDWLVLTSSNGVRAFLAGAERLGIGRTRLEAIRIAAVGPATDRALARAGLGAAFMPEEADSAALARGLTEVGGARILMVRSDRADRRLPEALEARGADRVDDVVGYRTVPSGPPTAAVEALREGVHAVTFTSPSTVAGFLKIGPAWRDLVGDAVTVTIGPLTTRAASEAGFGTLIEADERSVGGLVAALVRAFSD